MHHRDGEKRDTGANKNLPEHVFLTVGTSKGIVRVLVADDEPTIRRLVQDTLQQQRLFVKTCSDGLEVLEALDRAAYSVVVLDGVMPRMTGFEVVQRLRARGEEVPVILMTELDADVVQQLCEGLTMVTLLSKPFGIQELKDAVRSVSGRIRS